MTLRVPRHLRNRHLLMLDAILLGLCTLAAYVVRFEGFDWGPGNLYTALVYLAVSLPLKLGVLHSVGLYRRLWRFAGVAELEHILVATAISASLSSLVGAAILPGTGITPIRVPLQYALPLRSGSVPQRGTGAPGRWTRSSRCLSLLRECARHENCGRCRRKQEQVRCAHCCLRGRKGAFA